MAEANYVMYNLLSNQNAEEDVYSIYLHQWQKYKDLYLKKEEIEYNEKKIKGGRSVISRMREDYGK